MLAKAHYFKKRHFCSNAYNINFKENLKIEENECNTVPRSSCFVEGGGVSVHNMVGFLISQKIDVWWKKPHFLNTVGWNFLHWILICPYLEKFLIVNNLHLCLHTLYLKVKQIYRHILNICYAYHTVLCDFICCIYI